MSSINMKSVINKVKAVMTTPKFQKIIEQRVDSIILNGGSPSSGSGQVIAISGIQTAATKFIEVLKNEIETLRVGAGEAGFSEGRLGSTAVDALIKLKHGTPVKVEKNRYQISIWFTDNLHRESLDPDEYNGIDNIAALLNNGYKAGHSVYGVWNGHHNDEQIFSLTQRDGAHFIESAVRNYMANYAANYGVIDIEIDDAYR